MREVLQAMNFMGNALDEVAVVIALYLAVMCTIGRSREGAVPTAYLIAALACIAYAI